MTTKRLPKPKVVVIGDAMIDMYHFGSITQLSQEAPVPIFVEDYHHAKGGVRRGGADNVAAQLEEYGFNVDALFPEKRSVKHRYFVGHHLVFRRDSDQYARPDWDEDVDYVERLRGAQAVVLSDYDKGALTPDTCRRIIAAANAGGIPVVVDPKKSDWEKFDGAYVICPNEHEYDEWLASHSASDWVSKYLCLKRSSEGIDIVDRMTVTNYPTQAKVVFDVTGAGDIVVATLAAVIATGGTIHDGARLANIAAGYVVGIVGTAICPRTEISL